MSGPKLSDIRVTAAELFLIPVQARVPIKFGPEVLTEVTCARVRLTVADRSGRSAFGWGETPLNVQWVWPSELSYSERHDALVEFCRRLTSAWVSFGAVGHPLEVGHDFQKVELARLRGEFNLARRENQAADSSSADANREPDSYDLPYLAALVCCSPFDIALHDAYGRLLERDTYETYSAEFLSRDLSEFLEPADRANVNFAGLSPDVFLETAVPTKLKAWHLIGGLDPLSPEDLTGEEPNDGYPVLLEDWIHRDGLKCLKVKLRGVDSEWDYERLVRVGEIAIRSEVTWLTADFNCTVSEPEYVNEILDRLRDEHPRIYGMLLYIEQPFPYDLEKYSIDCRSVAARKPVFLDESAHDWQHVRIGRELGWSGVALKTCKTQTGAILSLCWAKAHGMPLMVQDLANPMLAQVTHLRLAAHSGTIMGVETNSMQFYPDASLPESKVHPGMFSRRDGCVDLSTLGETGFGYREDEIARDLPEADTSA
jgi:L-alanine-DL-glutamate epimerase-like enolase superfamily enzyme